MVQEGHMKGKDWKPMYELSSAQNAKFKRWESLLEAKGIKRESRALVSGLKLVQELLQSMPDRVEDLIYPPKADPLTDDIRSTRLSSPLFKKLDVLGTHQPLAVVEISPVPEWTPGPPEGLELIVSLSDPSNLGALLRSAEAFGASHIILTQECASPFLPKAIKAASLSTFRVKLARTGSLKELRLERALGLDMEGESLQGFKWPKNCHLILGEEGQGLPLSLNVKRIRIPMAGAIESLNATVAASIALYSSSCARGISHP